MSPTEWPHYKKALENFLVSSQGNLTPATSSRVTKAREKLKKLTKIQFSDLSTDVYDEMQRRELHNAEPSNSNLPKYLASQPNYHPKRNQARQKLAALPPSRFKDLVNDVLFEIGNRMHKEDSHQDQSTTINDSIISSNPKLDKNIKSDNNNSSNKHNLTVDTTVSKQFNDDFYSDLKTPQNSDFVSLTKTNPATPSQREIKPTTLVPKKSELTWSSDEDEDEDEDDNENENENENAHKTHTITENDLKKLSEYNEFENKNIDVDAINRSPSKRETVATNEILNVHSLPHVEFPVDNDTQTNYEEERENIGILKEELNDLKFKVEGLQSENSKLKLEISQKDDLKLENNNLKTKLEELNRENLEFKNLTEKYSDYDQIKNELLQVKETFANQSQELESLREIADQGHEKQLSVEDSREFDTLKTYLDKVLEENEELKTKLADTVANSENTILNIEEFGDLKKKHENLTQSHASLSKDYKSLKSYSDDLANKFEQQKIALEVANKLANPKKSTTTIQANTSAVKDWQEKFEALRANQIQSKLLSLSSSQDFSNKSFFSSNGYISVENISKLNSTLETILIYLDSKDEATKSLVDPSLLFERVANFVSIANNISKEVNVLTNDKNFVRVEEKKRILKNSISNALSTTKHYALYRHILPQLVLNASLNDVYFSTISLISIAKIRGNSPQNVSEIKKQYLEDAVTSTTSPIALKKSGNIQESPISVETKNLNKNNIENESNVKPLKITQRLASGSTLDVNDFSKPLQLSNSGNSSPMGRKILSPILPVIATPNKAESMGSPRSSSGNIRSLARQGSSDAIGSMKNVSNLNLELKSVPIEQDTSVLSNDSSFISENSKQLYLNSKLSVSDLTSKFTVPNQETADVSITKNNSPSPSRGKNIAEKLKKFDSPSGNKANVNSNINSDSIKDSPTSSKAKFGNGIAKAFDKFGAKRRSVEPADAILKENFSDDSKGIPTTSGISDNLGHSSKEDINSVLSDKDLNVISKKVTNNPFLDKSNEIKKGSLFENNEIKKSSFKHNHVSNKIDENINEADNGDELYEGDEYFNAQDIKNDNSSNSKLSNPGSQQMKFASTQIDESNEKNVVSDEGPQLNIPYRKNVDDKTQRGVQTGVDNSVSNISIPNAETLAGNIAINKDSSSLMETLEKTDIASLETSNRKNNSNTYANKDLYENEKSIENKSNYTESKLKNGINVDLSKLSDYPSDKSVYSSTTKDDVIKSNQNDDDEVLHMTDNTESSLKENFYNPDSESNNSVQFKVNGNFKDSIKQHSSSESHDNTSSNNIGPNGEYELYNNVESIDNAESNIEDNLNLEQNYKEQSKTDDNSFSDINEYPNSNKSDNIRDVDGNIVSNIEPEEHKNLRSNETNKYESAIINPINSGLNGDAQYNKDDNYVSSKTKNLKDDFEYNKSDPSNDNNDESNLNVYNQSNNYNGVSKNVDIEPKGKVHEETNTKNNMMCQYGSNNNDESEEWNSASSSPFKSKVELSKMGSNPSLKNNEVNNGEKYDNFNGYEEPSKDSNQIIDDSLPSAGSALDIDENLIRRVSRRQSYRKSLQGNSANDGLSHNSSYNNNNKSSSKQEFSNINENRSNNETPIKEGGDVKEGWDYQDEESEDEEEEFDIDKFNTLNPDNTLRELLLYLEHQTVEVIGAIQKTLQSIRDPKATKGLLREGTNEINAVVKQMAEGTSTLMNQSRYSESMGHAKYVVGVLEDCVHRMNALYGSDTSNDSEYAGKNFKQRSAGIAFDVARSTKELVKTVEEASLRDEIAVLDSRLRRD